jgi:carbamoyltransferase
MIIVGIKCGGHDPSMAILQDGKIVRAAEEERFTRVKHAHKSLPINSVRWGLQSLGLTQNDVDFWAVHHAKPHRLFFLVLWPYIKRPPLNFADLRFTVIQIKSYFTFIFKDWRRNTSPTQEFFKKMEVDNPKIFFVEHHLAHSLSATLYSDIPKGLSISMDGKGDNSSIMIGVLITSANRVRINTLNRINLNKLHALKF